MQGTELATGDTLEYAWRSGRWGRGNSRSRRETDLGEIHRTPVLSTSVHSTAVRSTWNRVGAQVAALLAIPAPGSAEEFVVEHYWGYNHGRDGRTREYRVTHPTWRVAPATNVTWDCDLLATYATPFVEYLAAPPTTALIAAGSPIQVFRGRRI